MMEEDMENGRSYMERPRKFSTVRSKKSSIPLVFRRLMRINPRALIILFLLVFSGVLYVGASTSPIVVFVFCICTLSLFFSFYLAKWVLAKDEGPPEMSEVILLSLGMGCRMVFRMAFIWGLGGNVWMLDAERDPHDWMQPN